MDRTDAVIVVGSAARTALRETSLRCSASLPLKGGATGSAGIFAARPWRSVSATPSGGPNDPTHRGSVPFDGHRPGRGAVRPSELSPLSPASPLISGEESLADRTGTVTVSSPMGTMPRGASTAVPPGSFLVGASLCAICCRGSVVIPSSSRGALDKRTSGTACPASKHRFHSTRSAFASSGIDPKRSCGFFAIARSTSADTEAEI